MIYDGLKSLVSEEFDESEQKEKLLRARMLVLRGLNDKTIVLDVLKKEKKIPDRLPAELYDKTNYLCRRYMDRVIHFELEYDFIPDIDALKIVLICLVESAPVFHSKFVDNHIVPYWEVSDYIIDDIISFEEVSNLDTETEEFLLNGLDVNSNIQMKICVFSDGQKSKICVVVNHMCIDGRGLITLLNDLFRNYDSYINNGAVDLYYSGKSRSYERVYDDMSSSDRKAAKKLYSNKSVKDNHKLPFSPKSSSDFKYAVRKKIAREDFETARLAAKKFNATANDLITAAYIRAFYEMTNCSEKEGVGISCAVDLRRHMKCPGNIGYTNHTAFMPCVVSEKGGTMTNTLMDVAKCTKESKKDRFVGLYGLPLLKTGYSTMIFAQADLVINAFYNVANLSVSNLGTVDPECFSINGNEPSGMWFGGATKEKPCGAVNVVSYKGDLMLCAYAKGNESDKRMIERFFEIIENNIRSLSIQN